MNGTVNNQQLPVGWWIFFILSVSLLIGLAREVSRVSGELLSEDRLNALQGYDEVADGVVGPFLRRFSVRWHLNHHPAGRQTCCFLAPNTNGIVVGSFIQSSSMADWHAAACLHSKKC